MSRIISALMTFLFCLSSLNIPVYAQTPTSVIVEYKTSDNRIIKSIKNKYFFNSEQKHLNGDFEVLNFDNVAAADNAVRRLCREKYIKYAEIDHEKTLMGVVSSDPFSDRQWGHSYAEFTTAWEALPFQKKRVVVAQIDTGINASHTDLKGRILPGYNAVNFGMDTSDKNGHGTQVAGVIAATTNNKRGIAGACGEFDTVILPIKVIDDNSGKVLLSSVVEGINFAVEYGVDVINISLGSKETSQAELSAINRASAAGIVVVAASGNDGSDTLYYPASYEEVISVSSHNKYGNASASSTHNSYVDVCAPGEDIYTTTVTGGYDSAEGTSYSCAYVSAIAAMIKAISSEFTCSQITDNITQTAVKPSGQSDRNDYFGDGYVNAASAVRRTLGFENVNLKVSLNYDRVHLASGLNEIELKPFIQSAEDKEIIWYEETNPSVKISKTFILSKSDVQSGDMLVTAKVPLSDCFAKCRCTVISSNVATSIANALLDVSISNGVLLGDFNINKTFYYINAENGVIPTITPQLLSSDISYLQKNASEIGENTIVEIIDSSGNRRKYTFNITEADEGVYKYSVENNGITTFAAATYKQEGTETVYMICVIYDDKKRLVKSIIKPIVIGNGFNNYSERNAVLSGQTAEIYFFKDLASLLPYENVYVY